ncbi:hypothetical protein VP96_03652 [Vibrio cholerae]|nr:hypothetical protein VCCP103811_0848 [Vibrio cholerae CP1038(11)]EJH37732.1 hypothetical protein VCCP104821_3856 [Vibrio cholerae CP1048(21)]KKP08302.1 hypothetical protein VP96_03652 [Vibrio cholerae]
MYANRTITHISEAKQLFYLFCIVRNFIASTTRTASFR